MTEDDEKALLDVLAQMTEIQTTLISTCDVQNRRITLLAERVRKLEQKYGAIEETEEFI